MNLKYIILVLVFILFGFNTPKNNVRIDHKVTVSDTIICGIDSDLLQRDSVIGDISTLLSTDNSTTGLKSLLNGIRIISVDTNPYNNIDFIYTHWFIILPNIIRVYNPAKIIHLRMSSQAIVLNHTAENVHSFNVYLNHSTNKLGRT
jgi:hypothetical protein